MYAYFPLLLSSKLELRNRERSYRLHSIRTIVATGTMIASPFRAGSTITAHCSRPILRYMSESYMCHMENRLGSLLKPEVLHQTTDTLVLMLKLQHNLSISAIVDTSAVAIKLSNNQAAVQTEQQIRSQRNFQTDRILPVTYVSTSEFLHDMRYSDYMDPAIHVQSYQFVAVMTLADRSLLDIMHHEVINATIARAVLFDVALALEHMHSKGIAYGNLRPSHVLRMPSGRYLLTDLSKARPFQSAENLTANASTDCAAVSPPNDMWDLGLLMYYLITGRLLLHTDRNGDRSDEEEQLKLSSWQQYPDLLERKIRNAVSDTVAADLLYSLLHPRPEQRPQTMEGVLQHPYFAVLHSSTFSAQMAAGATIAERSTEAASTLTRNETKAGAENSPAILIQGDVIDRLHNENQNSFGSGHSRDNEGGDGAAVGGDDTGSAAVVISADEAVHVLAATPAGAGAGAESRHYDDGNGDEDDDVLQALVSAFDGLDGGVHTSTTLAMSVQLCDSRVIGQEGGFLRGVLGVSVEIPPGAMVPDGSKELSLEILENVSKYAHLPTVAPIVRLTPCNYHFRRPVYITAPHCLVHPTKANLVISLYDSIYGLRNVLDPSAVQFVGQSVRFPVTFACDATVTFREPAATRHLCGDVSHAVRCGCDGCGESLVGGVRGRRLQCRYCDGAYCAAHCTQRLEGQLCCDVCWEHSWTIYMSVQCEASVQNSDVLLSMQPCFRPERTDKLLKCIFRDNKLRCLVQVNLLEREFVHAGLGAVQFGFKVPAVAVVMVNDAVLRDQEPCAWRFSKQGL